MGFLKHSIPAVCAAGLLSAAAAQLQGVDSVASCSIQLQSGGTADALSATAIAAAEATADLLCNGTLLEDSANAVASAEAIAFAAAEAVALVSVDCYNTGNSRFTVDGVSIAQARAEAYASAYVSATASASVCSPSLNCTAVAAFVGAAFERIFAEAVAIAEVTLDQDSPDTTVMAFAQNVSIVTAEVWAVALANATASVEEGCDLGVLGLGGAGDSFVFCAIDVATEDNSTAEDATVEVAVDAVAASGCNGSAMNITEESGEGLASAIASVIAEVAGGCETAGNGSICVTGEANITAVAEATASAFARAFLNASSTCENTLCESSVEVVTEAVTNVAAQAAASILVEACVEGGGSIAIEEFESDFVANTSLAFAAIIANATVVGGECFIDVNITAAAVIVLPTVNDTMMGNDTDAMGNDTDTMMGNDTDTMMGNDTDTMMGNDTDTMGNDTDTMGNDTDTMMGNDTTGGDGNDTTDGDEGGDEGDAGGDVEGGDGGDGDDCPEGTECVRDNRQCAGTGFPIAQPCCSDNYLCVRRNNDFAQCRLDGIPGLVNWEGSILPCGVPSDIDAADLPTPP